MVDVHGLGVKKKNFFFLFFVSTVVVLCQECPKRYVLMSMCTYVMCWVHVMFLMVFLSCRACKQHKGGEY